MIRVFRVSSVSRRGNALCAAAMVVACLGFGCGSSDANTASDAPATDDPVSTDSNGGPNTGSDSGVRPDSDSGAVNDSGSDATSDSSSDAPRDTGDTESETTATGTEGTPWQYDTDQPTRLRITNRCAYPIWIQFGDGDGKRQVLENHNPGANNRRFTSGESFDYAIPDEGDIPDIINAGIALEGTRFWVKRGCDEKGDNCTVGQSRTNSDGTCPPGGCHPPIESKMEATWASLSSGSVTWYNASHVDGYSEPYVIIPKGAEAKTAPDCIPINASMLDAAAQCPAHENLTDARYTDLDLRFVVGGEVLGCYSPCKKITYDDHVDEWTDPLGLRMCCPTNTSGVPHPGLTSEECNNREHPYSIWNTAYLQHLKETAPTVYTFAYDDAESLFTCPGTTKFELIFCPERSSAQPAKLIEFYERNNRPIPTALQGVALF
ncbi:MAG: thaumatin family protein [Myxococcales bacterium]|nr:thaumatin family protein [Myxococcales bacterium]